MAIRSRTTHYSTSKRFRGQLVTASFCVSKRAIRGLHPRRPDVSSRNWLRARSSMCRSRWHRSGGGLLALLGAILSVVGCTQKMALQPYYRPYTPSDVFADASSARPIPADTVARGHLADDSLLFTGKDSNGKDADQFPYPI